MHAARAREREHGRRSRDRLVAVAQHQVAMAILPGRRRSFFVCFQPKRYARATLFIIHPSPVRPSAAVATVAPLVAAFAAFGSESMSKLNAVSSHLLAAISRPETCPRYQRARIVNKIRGGRGTREY